MIADTLCYVYVVRLPRLIYVTFSRFAHICDVTLHVTFTVYYLPLIVYAHVVGGIARCSPYAFLLRFPLLAPDLRITFVTTFIGMIYGAIYFPTSTPDAVTTTTSPYTTLPVVTCHCHATPHLHTHLHTFHTLPFALTVHSTRFTFCSRYTPLLRSHHRISRLHTSPTGSTSTLLVIWITFPCTGVTCRYAVDLRIFCLRDSRFRPRDLCRYHVVPNVPLPHCSVFDFTCSFTFTFVTYVTLFHLPFCCCYIPAFLGIHAHLVPHLFYAFVYVPVRDVCC